MNLFDLLMSGVNLMLIGMGTVFVFLTLLVVSVVGMSKLALFLAPPRAKVPSGVSLPTGGQLPEHIAAISVAIKRYRADHPR